MNIPKILMISKLVLVLILAYTIVTTIVSPTDFASIKAPAPASASSQSRPINSNDHPNLSAEDYAQIVQKNPFDGSARLIAWVHPEGSESQLFDPSVSSELGLALMGTISGSPSVARAIIKDLKSGASELCRAGQVINNCRIQSIHPNSVVLLYDGKERVLRLNSDYTGENRSHDYSFDSGRRSTGPKLPSTRAEQPQTSFQYRMQSVETVLEEAIIQPHIVNGQVEGLRITGIENIEGAEALGLKNGDVIRAVNGHILTSKKQAYQVMKKARAKDVMNFELLRNNRTKEFTFPIK